MAELLARLAAAMGAAVYLSDDELDGVARGLGGRAEGLAHASAERAPARARSARVASARVRCRWRCWPDDGDGAAAFIVCDKRHDINRVEVPIAALSRWKATGELLADGLAQLLKLEARPEGADAANRWALGMLEGRHHKDRLALHAGDGGLTAGGRRPRGGAG